MYVTVVCMYVCMYVYTETHGLPTLVVLCQNCVYVCMYVCMYDDYIQTISMPAVGKGAAGDCIRRYLGALTLYVCR